MAEPGTPEYAKEKKRIWRLKQYHSNREVEKEKMRNYMRSFRPRLLQLLGDKCVKCGFSDVRALQIDHIGGGGLKELKVFKNNTAMYRFYLDHPIQAKRRLQILCANCNAIKKYENKENYVAEASSSALTK